MSNVDPRVVYGAYSPGGLPGGTQAARGWTPPPPYQPHRAAYVFAVILPLTLVLALAAPFGALYALSRSSSPTERANGDIPPGGPADTGEAGVQDPYFPDYGSSGYDAIKYDISVDFDPRNETITGTTKITARATTTLRSFFFDLVLGTDSVQVNGQPAEFDAQGYQDVEVRPPTPVNAGAVFEVTVAYSGRPGSIEPRVRRPWSVTNQEWTAAGEPESAAWWYPSNDYPADPALMDIAIRVPAGMEAISVGRLESADRDNEATHDTWHWVSSQPMATYLNFVTIGQYELRQGSVDDRAFVYAVTEQMSPADRRRAFAQLERSGEIVSQLERWFGPYPFTELGGVVPAHRLNFGGLENQTRPVYAAQAILDEKFAPELIAHELSHMWFGDHVTVRQWNDVCINECWASWGQWAYTESIGGQSVDDQFLQAYAGLKDNAAYWRITLIDPGPDHLFDVVYTRGPMMLQALRNRVGDDAFFALARDWAQQPGSRSLEEWMVKAQAATSVDLAPFFQAWILGNTAPARTKANGFPS
jgi:aminopeptidase N